MGVRVNHPVGQPTNQPTNHRTAHNQRADVSILGGCLNDELCSHSDSHGSEGHTHIKTCRRTRQNTSGGVQTCVVKHAKAVPTTRRVARRLGRVVACKHQGASARAPTISTYPTVTAPATTRTRAANQPPPNN
ncbi:hypothetical protein PTSG_13075 [Salpingoeca rosetta]|uniref:Uncharacterized protein n=1 Tax=Salpingoeca rosetta (strain ATCC 50818 / BSB-021) TaxID=946362 RepID=F2URX1_SALR5|nr:uncharacterized protein PTSG_13075 [Salpingoeca rosetta]EGD80376.1 hypothetical protein PTSG_13075 [Salpingoeca rosetta]|eukprot:XP_004988166.1 hypothetical protein PTSG_13075 [Salpingoeca rosetta]